MKKLVAKKRFKDRISRPQVVLVNRCIILDGKGRLLLIRRAPTDYHAGGLWEFPGDKLDKNQDISEALEREIMEETGLTVSMISRIAFTQSEIIPHGKYEGLPYVVLVGIGRLAKGIVKLSEEHTDYRWVTKAQAMKMDVKKEVKDALKTLSKSLKKSGIQ